MTSQIIFQSSELRVRAQSSDLRVKNEKYFSLYENYAIRRMQEQFILNIAAEVNLLFHYYDIIIMLLLLGDVRRGSHLHGGRGRDDRPAGEDREPAQGDCHVVNNNTY